MEKSCSKLDSKLFIAEKFRNIMTEELEKLKKSAKEYSDNLAKLGKELAKIQFNYKVIENTTERYWQNRINEIKKYNEKGTEYYTQAHALINLVDKEKSGLFLLSISKLRQLGLKLLTNMEEIKLKCFNPPIFPTRILLKVLINFRRILPFLSPTAK